MKKIILILSALAVIFLVGCQGIDLSKVSDDDLARLSEKAIVCNKPYIRLGTSCCLDKDDNGICDDDEKEEVEEKVLLSSETEEETPVKKQETSKPKETEAKLEKVEKPKEKTNEIKEIVAVEKTCENKEIKQYCDANAVVADVQQDNCDVTMELIEVCDDECVEYTNNLGVYEVACVKEVVGEMTSMKPGETTETFNIEEQNISNIEEFTLLLGGNDCDNDKGRLTVSINGHQLFSGNIPCSMVFSQPYPVGYLNVGRNNIVFEYMGDEAISLDAVLHEDIRKFNKYFDDIQISQSAGYMCNDGTRVSSEADC